MASRVITTLVDDTDGSEAAETVQFGLDGTMWEIDLSAGNAGKLRADLAGYVSKARKVGGRTRRASTGTPSLIDNKSVRKWAEANGIELSKRGRIPADIISQYQAAGD
jgi:Lsr2